MDLWHYALSLGDIMRAERELELEYEEEHKEEFKC
jgi:hypothetical protein